MNNPVLKYYVKLGIWHLMFLTNTSVSGHSNTFGSPQCHVAQTTYWDKNDKCSPEC